MCKESGLVGRLEMARGTAPAQSSQEQHGEALDELLVALDRHIKSNSYKEVAAVADEILALSPGDADALRCKVVVLIQDGNMSEALSVIDSANSSSSVDFRFQKAYCLYRSNRLDAALDALQGLEKSSSVLELEAQVLYRKGDMDLSIDRYETLFRDFGIQSDELKSNAIAAYVSGKRSTEVFKRMEVNPKNIFELAYNAACAMIENGELSQAEEHLLLARRLGQEMLLEAECSSDEIEDELAPVTTQLAYVQQMQGRASESAEYYTSLLERDSKDKDMGSVAVASTNLTAIRRNKDASDSLKKLEALLNKSPDGKQLHFVEGLQHKLSLVQKEAIVFNYFLLLLNLNKLNQARELITSLMDEYRDSSMPVLLKACLLIKEGKLGKLEEVLGEYAAKDSRSSTEALLLCAQARASSGHYLQAADSLERIAELKWKPATLATLIDLRERGGDLKGAEKILDDAVEWWSNTMDKRTDILELLIHKAANLKLKNKDLKAAGDLYQRITGSSSDVVRLEAFTGLICSSAEANLAKAESYEHHLPPLQGLAGVNTDALEQSSVLPDAKTRGSTGEHVEESTEGKKKKRKRKPRYPKGYDPENPGPPPDPERWLPMRERSSYRPKRKDKRAAQLRGSQGAVSKDVPASNGPSTSRPPSSTAKAASSDAKGSGNQKSKKKGRR